MVTRRLSWIGFGGTSRAFRSIVLPPYRLFIISILIVMHDRDQILRFLKISPPELKYIRIWPITWSTRHEFDGWIFLKNQLTWLHNTSLGLNFHMEITCCHSSCDLMTSHKMFLDSPNTPHSVKSLNNRPGSKKDHENDLFLFALAEFAMNVTVCIFWYLCWKCSFPWKVTCDYSDFDGL